MNNYWWLWDRIVSLFIFVLGVFLLAVWQTGLPGKRGDLEEKVMVAVNTQGHQEGSDSVEQVSCQHRPKNIIWNTKRSSGARMQEAPDVGPLTLEKTRKQDRKLCCHVAGECIWCKVDSPFMFLPGLLLQWRTRSSLASMYIQVWGARKQKHPTEVVRRRTSAASMRVKTPLF